MLLTGKILELWKEIGKLGCVSEKERCEEVAFLKGEISEDFCDTTKKIPSRLAIIESES